MTAILIIAALAASQVFLPPSSYAVPPSTPDSSLAKQPGAQRASSVPQATSEQVDAQAAAWHRVRMRVSGSKCATCLAALEKALAATPGVGPLKVKLPPLSYSQPLSPELNDWSDLLVFYDQRILSLDALKSAIRKAGYHPFKVADAKYEHAPDSKDLKF